MNNDFLPYLDKIENIIINSLPKNPDSNWKEKSFDKNITHLNENLFKLLIEPNKDLIQRGGKRWRPLFLVLSALSICEDHPELSESDKAKILDLAYNITPLVEFVHTASLIHDDIEDASDTRRGKPAIHISYGTDVAINAASWLYFQASTFIQNLNCDDELKYKFLTLYTKKVKCLHLGQAMDILWHKEKELIPSLEEYSTMVANKTGTLASLASQLALLSCSKKIHLKEELFEKFDYISSQIGIGFQIIDDVINISTGNVGKKRGDDIVEGKKSLPVLLFLEKATSEDKDKLLNCFKIAEKDGINSPAVEEAISLMEKYNIIQEAKEKGKQIIYDSCSDFENLFKKENTIPKKVSELFKKMIPQNF